VITKQNFFPRPSFWQKLGLSLQDIIIILLLALIGFSVGIWARQLLLDDAVITFRVAENLAYGRGFVFNVGERVQVTTTPLYTMVLAIGTWLFGSAMRAALILNLMLAGLIPVLAYGVGVRLYGRIVGISGGILLCCMPLLIIAFSMESYLYVALILASILAYTFERYYLTGVLAGLTALVRGDGALLGATLLSYDFIVRCSFFYKKQSKIQTIFNPPLLIPTVGLPLIWYLFALGYYGSPFPATLQAKAAQGEFNWLGVRFWQGLLDYWHIWVNKQAHTQLYLWLPFWLIGVIASIWRDTRWLILIGRDAFYITAFIVLGVPAAEWYYAPLMPGIALLTACGVQAVSTRLLLGIELSASFLVRRMTSQRTSIKEDNLTLNHSERAKFRILQIILTIILISLLLSPIILISQAIIKTHPDWKAQVYPKVGQWLAENTAKESNFATIDIGHLGYWSNMPIIDIVGLAQPDVAPHIAKGDFGYAIRHYEPDLVVLGYSWLPEIQRTAWFQASYTPRHYFKLPGLDEPIVVFSQTEGVKLQPVIDKSQLQLIDYNFNQKVQLTGVYYPQQVMSGDVVEVTLQWQSLRSFEADLTVFVQLLSADNQVVAQGDSKPQSGFYTTPYWQPDEVVLDRHLFRLPSDTPSGDYTILVGWYDAITGQRLPLLDNKSDHIQLDGITVVKEK